MSSNIGLGCSIAAARGPCRRPMSQSWGRRPSFQGSEGDAGARPSVRRGAFGKGAVRACFTCPIRVIDRTPPVGNIRGQSPGRLGVSARRGGRSVAGEPSSGRSRANRASSNASPQVTRADARSGALVPSGSLTQSLRRRTPAGSEHAVAARPAERSRERLARAPRASVRSVRTLSENRIAGPRGRSRGQRPEGQDNLGEAHEKQRSRAAKNERPVARSGGSRQGRAAR